jgi:Domain of unknown function (DUF2027)
LDARAAFWEALIINKITEEGKAAHIPHQFYISLQKKDMQYKKGQKIKFLNEEGGGTISKIEGSIVYVTTTDGFDVPVKMQEIIPIQASSHSERLFLNETDKQETEVENNKTQEAEQIEQIEDNLSALINVPAYPKADLGIYLAIVPQNQQWMLTSDLDIYLINNTPTDILYNILLKENDNYIGFDYGSCPAKSKIFLQNTSRDNISKWAQGVVQSMFHIEKGAFYYNTISADFKLKSYKLLQSETAYTNLNFMEEDAFFNQLISLSAIEKHELDIPKKENIEQKVEVKSSPIPSKLAKFEKEDGVYEIDLHAEKIVEDYQSFSPDAIMQKQVHYFKRTLELAIAENLKSIVFIHGVGVGRLKYELKKVLDLYDDKIEHEDASILKYGVGATKVKIY